MQIHIFMNVTDKIIWYRYNEYYILHIFIYYLYPGHLCVVIFLTYI